MGAEVSDSAFFRREIRCLVTRTGKQKWLSSMLQKYCAAVFRIRFRSAVFFCTFGIDGFSLRISVFFIIYSF